MKSQYLLLCAALLFLQRPAVAEDEIKLVYPIAAASAPLDAAAPPITQKRTTAAPVKEAEEIDVETPIGQVQSVLDSLNTIKERQEGIESKLDSLDTKDGSKITEILDNLKEAQEERGAIAEAIEAAAKVKANGGTIASAVLVFFVVLVVGYVGKGLLNYISKTIKQSQDNRDAAIAARILEQTKGNGEK